jgi:hypothetical protein
MSAYSQTRTFAMPLDGSCPLHQKRTFVSSLLTPASRPRAAPPVPFGPAGRLARATRVSVSCCRPARKAPPPCQQPSNSKMAAGVAQRRAPRNSGGLRLRRSVMRNGECLRRTAAVAFGGKRGGRLLAGSLRLTREAVKQARGTTKSASLALGRA